MIGRARVVVGLALAGALVAPAAWPATKLEGEYQLQLQLRKDLRAFPWDFDANDGAVSNRVEFRLYATPRPGAEAFLKTEARWDRGNNFFDRPELQFREAHVGFKREAQGRGVNALLFSRQRRFWVDNYLINFVNDRDNAQGIRVDTWGFLGMNAAFIVGDQSDQMDPPGRLSDYERIYGYPAPLAPRDSLNRQASRRTDDLYVMRLRREFLKERRLRLGTTWNRYEGWTGRDSTSDRQRWNSVLGFDSRYRWKDTDVSLEFGVSRLDTGDVAGIDGHQRGVLQAEIRSLRFGTPRWGYFAVTPGYWIRGPRYTNSLGGPGSDEAGYNIQSYYLLPERAITYSNQFLGYHNRAYSERRIREHYHELYVEFVNGFTGKTAYRRRDEFDVRRRQETKASYLSWFNEVQVESRLAWLRFQSKLQNIGRQDRKQLFVIENRLNLTDQTKIYARYALGNDPSRLRKAIFTQLQYRPTDSMELFLQYGPDYIGGGSNPVDEGNLTGSGDHFDELRFTLRGIF
jgi:hypothetical protein